MNAAAGKKSGNLWTWVVSGFALIIIILTIVLPPPGDNTDPEGDALAGKQGEMVDTEEALQGDTVRIRVLNGTEKEGFASRTQGRLIAVNDSLVLIAPEIPFDAPNKPYKETIIVSHNADLTGARFIAECLGLTDSSVVWEIPADGTQDSINVTIYLGEDI